MFLLTKQIIFSQKHKFSRLQTNTASVLSKVCFWKTDFANETKNIPNVSVLCFVSFIPSILHLVLIESVAILKRNGLKTWKSLPWNTVNSSFRLHCWNWNILPIKAENDSVINDVVFTASIKNPFLSVVQWFHSFWP